MATTPRARKGGPAQPAPVRAVPANANDGGESAEKLLAVLESLEKLVTTFEEEVARPIADDIGGVVTQDFEDTDLARVLLERETSENLAHLLAQDREQVEHALERMREGGYGVCEDCGRRIPAERLKFNPAATRCVPCQGDWERVNGRTA